jgi:hypothetical protein
MSDGKTPERPRRGLDQDRDLKAKIRRLADEERERIRQEERAAMAFDSGDSGANTKPIDLIERAAIDPDGPPRNRDLIELHERVAKRAKHDTANKLEGRLAKVEFPVRIMWALFIFAASIAGASMFTAVSYIRTSATEGARAEYRLQAAEKQMESAAAALRDVTTRLRDIEESARLNALRVEELQRQRRSGSNTQRTP